MRTINNRKKNMMLTFIYFPFGLIDIRALDWIEHHFIGIEGTMMLNGLGFIQIVRMICSIIIIIIKNENYIRWSFRRAS
jgi:hypothetical protein